MLNLVQTEDKRKIYTSGMNHSIDLAYCITVPSPVQNVMVTREKQRKFNISWEEPEEPNDYALNYTVTVTDINTGDIELNRAVDEMDQLEVLSQALGMYNYFFTLHISFLEDNTKQNSCSPPNILITALSSSSVAIHIFVSLCHLCRSQDSGQMCGSVLTSVLPKAMSSPSRLRLLFSLYIMAVRSLTPQYILYLLNILLSSSCFQ